ncbi:MAG: alpha/beta fold hydrolase [Sphaerochaetaceae bacterium]|nr:alpha/beta fold hydrolase [Sphaerochaetaceae bacterium]
MVYALIAILVALAFSWSALLWGYRDRYTEPLYPAVDEVFDRRCLPIILEHEVPAKKAIIMVHGFPSTPYSFNHAAKKAYEHGYDVYAPLLPGFGTKPEDLYHTSFTQWYGYLEEYYRDKRVQYDTLFVVGTSMGGSMTLKLAERFSGTEMAPDGIATVAAPVFLNDVSIGAIQRWGYYFMRLVAIFTPALGPRNHTGSERKNDGEELWVGYGGSFVRGGVSLMHALKTIRKELGKITVPLFAMHDVADRTISFQNLGTIQSEVKSDPFVARTTAMTSDHNRHTLLMYPSVREDLTNEMIRFFDGLCQDDGKKEHGPNETQ